MDASHFGLGKLIGTAQERDAVHIAVAPMKAAVPLKPGQHVGTDGNGFISASEPHIGVVDPYLRSPVRIGETCWLFLYPGTIVGLRHEWAHPAFGAREVVTKSSSEKWMRAWAMKHVSDDYDGDGKKSENAAYAFAIDAGHEHHIGPYEDARDHIDNEWWSHWEIITGKSGDRAAYFTCGC